MKLEQARELAKLRIETGERLCHGMEIEDDGMAPGTIEADTAAILSGMGGVKAKGGAFFAATMLAGDLSGIEFISDYVRKRAQELARSHQEKEAKSASDAALRTLAPTTLAVGGGGGGGGEGLGRVGGVAAKDVSLGKKSLVSCRLLTPAKQQLFTLVSVSSKPPPTAWPLRFLRTSSRRPSSSQTPRCQRKSLLP